MPISRTVSMLVAIWGVYFVCSVVNQGRMLYASVNTELLILSFILALALGSVLNYCFAKKESKRWIVYKLSPRGILATDYVILLYLLLVCIVLVRFYTYRYFYNVELSRIQIYSPVIRLDGRLLSGVYDVCLYLKGVSSAVVSFVFVRSLFEEDRKRVAIIGMIKLFDAFVFSAKGPIIDIGFMFLFYFVFKRRIPFGIKWKSALFMTMPLILMLWFVDASRDNNFFASFTSYFTIGPALLSTIVDGAYGSGYHHWVPSDVFMIFSGFDYLIVIAARFAGVPIQSAGYDWIKYTDIPMVVSSNAHKFLPYNTFYTLLSEPYMSFGLVGVIFLGLAAGWIISVLEKNYLRERCDRSLFWLQYLVGIVFFGVFVSPFRSVVFWMVVGLMFFAGAFVFEKSVSSKN